MKFVNPNDVILNVVKDLLFPCVSKTLYAKTYAANFYGTPNQAAVLLFAKTP